MTPGKRRGATKHSGKYPQSQDPTPEIRWMPPEGRGFSRFFGE